MVHIVGGKFQMGGIDGATFESPVHSVELSDFLIDAKMVTNSDFAAFVESTGYVTTAESRGYAWGFNGTDYGDIDGLHWKSYATSERHNHPVLLVSWFDAKAYADWQGKALPTEAQWEFVARDGLNGKLFPWGDERPSRDNCVFDRPQSAMPGTAPVGSLAPNSFGVFDLVGNAWEWCEDWYSPNFYARSPRENPQGPSSGTTKVRRGAAWNVVQDFRLRCSNRGAMKPDSTVPNLGFRCVKNDITLDEEFKSRQVEACLNQIRPAMEADGGGVSLVSVNGGVVTLRLKGACTVCPSAELTIGITIEPTLKSQLHWIERVDFSA